MPWPNQADTFKIDHDRDRHSGVHIFNDLSRHDERPSQVWRPLSVVPLRSLTVLGFLPHHPKDYRTSAVCAAGRTGPTIDPEPVSTMWWIGKVPPHTQQGPAGWDRLPEPRAQLPWGRLPWSRPPSASASNCQPLQLEGLLSVLTPAANPILQPLGATA